MKNKWKLIVDYPVRSMLAAWLRVNGYACGEYEVKELNGQLSKSIQAGEIWKLFQFG